MKPLTIVYQPEDIKTMERALESYELRLRQMALELEHFGHDASSVWRELHDVKSCFRRTLDQHVEQRIIDKYNPNQ